MPSSAVLPWSFHKGPDASWTLPTAHLVTWFRWHRSYTHQIHPGADSYSSTCAVECASPAEGLCRQSVQAVLVLGHLLNMTWMMHWACMRTN